MIPAKLDTVVIGAGFAGLGVGAALKEKGVQDFAILDRGDRPGFAWSRRYDRLHLHSAFHDMPADGGMRREYPTFMPSAQMVEYLGRYATLHGLTSHLHTHARVMRVERASGGGWRIETTRGATHARYVAVATAINRVPSTPTVPEREAFAGEVLHSADYRNAERFRGASALIVGSGNSAAEIALDLVEGGAGRVAMRVRGPRHFVPRAVMGAMFRFMRFIGQMSSEKQDAMHRVTYGTAEYEQMATTRDKLFVKLTSDLSRYGIRKPATGPATETALYGRIPTFDVGAMKYIRNRRIEVIDGNARLIRCFAEGGVELGDRVEHFDVVIFATGFHPGLEEFIADKELLGASRNFAANFPLTDNRCRSRIDPSMFFPGFDPTPIGGLSLGRWGWEVGERIADELNQPASSAAPEARRVF